MGGGGAGGIMAGCCRGEQPMAWFRRLLVISGALSLCLLLLNLQ
eukprot:COSAG04_NODE_9257_length_882_cov_0.740741_2_plen_43_part_01